MSTFHDRRHPRSRSAENVEIDILPPEEAKGKVIHFRRPLDVVDAHFEPVRDRTQGRGSVHALRSRIRSEVVAPRRRETILVRLMSGVEGRLHRMPSSMFMATVAVAVVAIFMLFGGFSLIPHGKPAQTTASIDITHVTMTPQDANGMRVLLINGIVENRTKHRLDMPSIRADFLAGDTVVASTLISTSAAKIGGGESYGFSARVPHPGGKLPDLRLSLAPRGV